MAPKFKIPKTFADAVKEGNQNISGFFSVKRKPGRPKKAMMETPVETEQANKAKPPALSKRKHGVAEDKEPPIAKSKKRRKIVDTTDDEESDDGGDDDDDENDERKPEAKKVAQTQTKIIVLSDSDSD
jgi:hypothetical protein